MIGVILLPYYVACDIMVVIFFLGGSIRCSYENITGENKKQAEGEVLV